MRAFCRTPHADTVTLTPLFLLLRCTAAALPLCGVQKEKEKKRKIAEQMRRAGAWDAPSQSHARADTAARGAIWRRAGPRPSTRVKAPTDPNGSDIGARSPNARGPRRGARDSELASASNLLRRKRKKNQTLMSRSNVNPKRQKNPTME